jgi:hypothetical protein
MSLSFCAWCWNDRKRESTNLAHSVLVDEFADFHWQGGKSVELTESLLAVGLLGLILFRQI